MHEKNCKDNQSIMCNSSCNRWPFGQNGNDFCCADMFERETEPTGKKLTNRNDIKALLFDMLTAGIDTSTTTTEWAMAEESCCDQETAGGDRVACRKSWSCKAVCHPLKTRDVRHNTYSVPIHYAAETCHNFSGQGDKESSETVSPL